MNVNCKIAELPKELQAIAETMQNVLGKAIDLNPLTIDLVQTTLTAYHDFLNTDIENALLHNWNMLSATHNKTVKINTGNAVITGTAMGINTKGNLNVRQEDGKIINVNVGDVIN